MLSVDANYSWCDFLVVFDCFATVFLLSFLLICDCFPTEFGRIAHRSKEKAIRAAKLLAEHDVLWLEEPTLPDDFKGYARIREEGGLAIAQGENLHTLHEFTTALTTGKIDFPQADASNIGGGQFSMEES